MPELPLKQPRFTYSACGPFSKHCERNQKFRETGNLKHLHRNELGDVKLKKVSDLFDNEVVKNIKFSTLNTEVNNLKKKIPAATTLIHLNQYNTNKQNLKKKNWRC